MEMKVDCLNPPANKAAQRGADRDELLELRKVLARALSRSAAERASRVKRLVQEYRQGRYQVDPVVLARAILMEMLAAGHDEELARGSAR